jgi:ElaB/YqjD/DUF883 family membrane-anchored ribosome-binding protein
MSLKSQVTNAASDMASDLASNIEGRLESLPARLSDVRESVEGWGTQVRSYVRKNPATAIVAAFAIGYGLAKVARHA